MAVLLRLDMVFIIGGVQATLTITVVQTLFTVPPEAH